jgi:hypothetical protein
MRIKGLAMERHQVEARVRQGSLLSPILFGMYTSGLTKFVEGSRSGAERQAYVDDLGTVPTRCDVNHVVSIRERCAATRIDWANRRGVQFGTAKMEAALFTRR